VLGFLFRDRSGRIAKIAASAAPHLEPGEEVRELVQAQTGRTAAANELAVHDAFTHGKVDRRAEAAIQSVAVLATDHNIYAVTLTGIRLLKVGRVVFKEPLAEARVKVGEKVITINDVPLHVMEHFESHVEGLRDLVAAAQSPATSP
jgi:hypothetical protein